MSNKLSDHLHVSLNGTEHTIFMSFGLLNTLGGMIETIEQLTECFLSSEYREHILVQCLSERDEHGKVKTPFNLHSISPEKAEEILSWVSEHLEAFFIRRSIQKLKTIKKVNRAIADS